MPSANDVYITPASRKIEWYEGSAVKGQIYHDATNFYVSGTLDLKLQGADDISLMGYSGGSIITFGTDQTERMRLTEAGNLCIGTTSTTEKLRVEGNGVFNGHLYIAGVMHHLGNTDTYIGFTGTDTIEMQTGGASRLSINDAGTLLGGANARVTTILDEDNMASNSATALATQQSIKAYVDTNAGGGGTIGGSLSDNNIPIGTAAHTICDISPAYSEAQNIIIGRTQRNTTTDADDNTIFGYNAGYELTTGDRNVLIGRNAGDSITTAISNVAIGRYAMSTATTGGYMIAIGTSAGDASTDGSVSVGHTAGAAAGAKKVAIGYQALLYPSGSNNTAIGYKALIGASSGVVTAYNNTSVGYEAGMSITTGYQNVFMGAQAGDSITTATRNVIIGAQSVESSNTSESVILGAYAAFATSTAINSSVIIGAYASQNASPSKAVILGR